MKKMMPKGAKAKMDAMMDDDAGPVKLKGKQKARGNGKFGSGSKKAMRRTKSY